MPRRKSLKMPLPTKDLFPEGKLSFAKFNSRRSVVHSTKGIVSCTQPLAAKCGIEILDAGGNAAVSPKPLCPVRVLNPKSDEPRPPF